MNLIGILPSRLPKKCFASPSPGDTDKTTKKRRASRSLSPTQKRRKSAPPLYDQAGGNTQQTVQQGATPISVRQRPRRRTVNDHPSELLHSDIQPQRMKGDILDRFSADNVNPSHHSTGGSNHTRSQFHAQAEANIDPQRFLGSSHLTWNLPIRSGPSPGAIIGTGSEAVPESLARTQPRESGVQHGHRRPRRPTKLLCKTGADKNRTSNSRESSLSSDFLALSSPLDLGSPFLDPVSPSQSRASAIPSDSIDTLDSMVLDPKFSKSKSSGFTSNSADTLESEFSIDKSSSDFSRPSKRNLLYQRLVSGCSQDDRPFERSGCPSPTPSFRNDAVNPEACAEHTKGIISTPEFQRATSPSVGPIIREGESPPYVCPGDPIQTDGAESPSEMMEEKLSLAAMAAFGSSSRSSSASHLLSSANHDPHNPTKDEHKKFSTFCGMMSGTEDEPRQFFDLWKNAYVQQLATPEPLTVLPVLTVDETTQAINESQNEDNDHRNLPGGNDWIDIDDPELDAEEREAALQRLYSSDPPDNAYYRYLSRWTFEEVRELITPRGGTRHTRNRVWQRSEAGEYVLVPPTSPASDELAPDELAPDEPAPDVLAPIPSLDGAASVVDPSLEAGVYHNRRVVGSNTPEPVLQQTEEESVSPQPGQAGEPYECAECTLPRQNPGRKRSRRLHEQSGRPSQTAAPIPLPTTSPGLTAVEVNERIVPRDQAEETLERQRAHPLPPERRTNQRGTEEGQTGNIHEWIAGSTTPPRQSRGMMIQRRRRRAATSSDEAGCCLCRCLTPLRSLCCGRPRDPLTRDPLTEDRLHEHIRTTEEHQLSHRGSTTVAGENGSRPKSDQQQGNTNESIAPVEDPASAAPTHPAHG